MTLLPRSFGRFLPRTSRMSAGDPRRFAAVVAWLLLCGVGACGADSPGPDGAGAGAAVVASDLAASSAWRLDLLTRIGSVSGPEQLLTRVGQVLLSTDGRVLIAQPVD